MTAQSNDERYARGIEVLRRIGGPNYDVQLKAAAQTAPDLARLTVEFAYGDIIAREGLALPLRQVVTVAALLGHRNAERQLRYHMVGYLNAGGEARTLVELLFVSIAVLGFPVAIHAIAVVREIFKERGVEFARLAPRGRGMLIGAKNRGADSFMNQHLTHDLRPESYEVTDLLRSI